MDDLLLKRILAHNEAVDRSLLAELDRALEDLRSLGISVESAYRLTHPFDRQWDGGARGKPQVRMLFNQPNPMMGS